MAFRVLNSFCALLAGLALSGWAVHAEAQPATPAAMQSVADAGQPPGVLNVVVIEGLDAGRPLWLQFQSEFRGAFAAARSEPIALHIESIDAVRFPRVGYVDEYERWLTQKYLGRKVDAVVASSTVPLDRLLKWRREIWRNAPLVVVLIGPKSAEANLPREPGVTAVTWASDAPGTMALARRLFPQTKRVFLIGGEIFGDPVGDYLKAQLEGDDGLEVVGPESRTLAELEREVTRLPRDTVVLYSGVYQDARSTGYTSRDVLASLAGKIDRPIFGLSSTYLDHGIVGGVLLDPAAYARSAARTVDAMLDQPDMRVLPQAPPDGQTLTVDFRELKRWGVPERRLPPGTRVAFRPEGLWEQYHREVTVAAVLLALHSMLLVFLLVERRRRKHAEAGIHQLSRRLIVSQEDERRRIASELHDDLNQRVALLTIGLDGLAANAPTGSPEAAQLADLAGEARTLGSDVHALARRLRPPQIDTAGLPAALRDVATRMQRRTGVNINVLDNGWPSNAPVDGSIVFYRVAQEALQNALKHSGARSVRVALSGDPRQLVLSVSDDGVGIASDAADTGRGLGIAGMRERLHLVGGSLHITGIAGEGTTVSATIPLPMPVTA
jgi:signal transduction histidine kinase